MLDLDFNQLLQDHPELVWQSLLSLLSTLIAGITIAFVTTFYLKKKDEVTRVAGVILEKRINSEQVILDFLEKASYSLELPAGKSQDLYRLMTEHELELPHGKHLQYAQVFSSNESFQVFFREFEQQVSRHKLWLSKEVRFHLELMQAYFSWMNANLLMTQRVPLPLGSPLTAEENNKLSDKLILIQGISLDSEIKGFIAHLEVLMVDSIYHLRLNRVKHSMMRNGFLNRETKKMLKILDRQTLLGEQRAKMMALVITAVYGLKAIEPMDVDIDQFVES